MENPRVVVQTERCVGCGLCVQDCPANALRITDNTAAYIKNCFACGHCVAICPTNAISMPMHDMADVTDYNPASFPLQPENLLNTIKFRRSVRAYTDQKIPQSVLVQMMEAGRHTATARNTQATRFLVLQQELPAFKQAFWKAMPQIISFYEEKSFALAATFDSFYKKFLADGTDSFFFDAPAAIFVFSDNLWDAGLACGNIELMAVANGLGILHDGYLKYALMAAPQLFEPFGLEKEPIACCMLSGYAQRQYARTAPRKKPNYIIR